MTPFELELESARDTAFYGLILLVCIQVVFQDPTVETSCQEGSQARMDLDKNIMAMSAEDLASLFSQNASLKQAWRLFEELPDWTAREAVVQQLHARSQAGGPDSGVALAQYAECYKTALEGVISEEFYAASSEQWAVEYVDSPPIASACLSSRTDHSCTT